MTTVGPIRVGVVGAGVISQQYLTTLADCPDVAVVAIGDLVPWAARDRAEEFAVPTHGGVEAVIGNPDVDLVINLTIPAAHASVATAIVAAGQHVWNEKPLTHDVASATDLLVAATERGVRVGCAPDTVLGPGWQEVIRIIERGDIGEPQSALTLLQAPGPDRWHPNPDFLFQPGGGPLLDMGPYYLTALTQVFGPVASVSAVANRSHDRRAIRQGPRAGEEFEVTVPTHVGALLEFAGGGVAQSVFSFESAVRRTLVEITGTEGTLLAPDPNHFGGEISIHPMDADECRVVARKSETGRRGIGVVDMARAIAADQPHRATGELGAHVLEVLLAIESSAGSGTRITSTAPQRSPLPADWDPRVATL